MKPKTIEQLKKMSDIEITDYSLDMIEQNLNEDGSEESEYVFGRMADMIKVPTRGVDTSVQD